MSMRCFDLIIASETASLTPLSSYEALPPNFTVWENCAAGAFAGIAVRTDYGVEPLDNIEGLHWTRNTPSCILPTC